MKFLKWILVPVILLVAIVFGVYHFGKDFAIEKATERLESTGKIDEVKAMVKENPQLLSFIKEIETNPEAQQYLNDQASTETLPFDTREEAIGTVVNRVGITDLTKIINKVQNGTTSQEEVIQQLSAEFTEEEMMAMKIIMYKEMFGTNQ